MERVQLQRDLAVSEAEEKIFKGSEENENASGTDVKPDVERFTIPSFMPTSTVPAGLKDERPGTNLSESHFISSVPPLTPTSKPVLMQKPEQHGPVISSQLPRTYPER